MKKRIVIEILICLALVLGLVSYVQWTLPKVKSKTYSLDLSEFKGRITSSDSVNLEVPTTSVPLSKAITFGGEAILSYGLSGVKIWGPDYQHPGLYYYAEINSPGQEYEISLKNNKLVICAKPSMARIFAVIGLIAICAIIAWVCYQTITSIKAHRKPLKKPGLVDIV